MVTRNTTRTTTERKSAASKTSTATTTKKPATRTTAPKKSPTTRPASSSSPEPKRTSPTTAKKATAARKTTTATVTPGITPAPAIQAEVTPPLVTAPTKAKGKIVRDSFSLPKSEQESIKKLRTALEKAGRKTSKSEVLRAALDLLHSHDMTDIIARLNALPKVVKGSGKKSDKQSGKKTKKKK